jgi:hypothetical protein
LPRRNAEVENCTADSLDLKGIEDAIGKPKIGLPQRYAIAEPRESLGCLGDCLRVLIERENVGTCLQDCLAMSATAAGAV